MLGKGLESLIPPSKGNEPGRQSSGQHDDTGRDPLDFLPLVEEPLELDRVEPKLLDDVSAHFAPPHVAFPAPAHRPASAPAPAPVVPSARVPANAPVSAPNMHAPVAKSQERPQAKKNTEEYIYQIEVEKIKPNTSQPRRHFDEAAIRELAFSIREFGFLQPLVVTRVERETSEGVAVEYELIAGERRLMAAKTLGFTVVPAIVRNVNLEREKLELAVIENIQREGLNPIETARAFARLQDEFRLTQREIAAKLGKSREVVANSVRLLSLPVYIQTALEQGQLSESHGRLLLAIEDPASQKHLFDEITTRGMTTRDLRVRVLASKPPKPQREHASLSPEVKMMEDRLSAELGTPVKIERSAGTGKIVIQFYSEEELENIVQKIGKEDL